MTSTYDITLFCPINKCTIGEWKINRVKEILSLKGFATYEESLDRAKEALLCEEQHRQRKELQVTIYKNTRKLFKSWLSLSDIERTEINGTGTGVVGKFKIRSNWFTLSVTDETDDGYGKFKIRYNGIYGMILFGFHCHSVYTFFRFVLRFFVSSILPLLTKQFKP